MEALAVDPQVANDERAVADGHTAALLIVRHLRQQAVARPEVAGADVDEDRRAAAGSGTLRSSRHWRRRRSEGAGTLGT